MVLPFQKGRINVNLSEKYCRLQVNVKLSANHIYYQVIFLSVCPDLACKETWDEELATCGADLCVISVLCTLRI